MHSFKRFLLDTNILKQMAEYRVKRYELDVPLALIALIGMMFLFEYRGQRIRLRIQEDQCEVGCRGAAQVLG